MLKHPSSSSPTRFGLLEGSQSWTNITAADFLEKTNFVLIYPIATTSILQACSIEEFDSQRYSSGRINDINLYKD